MPVGCAARGRPPPGREWLWGGQHVSKSHRPFWRGQQPHGLLLRPLDCKKPPPERRRTPSMDPPRSMCPARASPAIAAAATALPPRAPLYSVLLSLTLGAPAFGASVEGAGRFQANLSAERNRLCSEHVTSQRHRTMLAALQLRPISAMASYLASRSDIPADPTSSASPMSTCVTCELQWPSRVAPAARESRTSVACIAGVEKLVGM